MITFDSLTLKLWIDENLKFLTGARIQKIQQPTRRDFVFVLRNQGESKKFYININPQFFHVCFMNKQNEMKRYIEIPQKPPMFCMLLRKYLENAVISKVNQPPYERILEFYIETYNELSEKIYLCLAIELMGKYSNVILYNYDTNIIIGCAHNVGSEKSRDREMAGGLPYVYPSGRPCDWYCGKDSFANKSGGINELIDNYYSKLIYDNKFKKLKDNCVQILCKRLKKAENSLRNLEKQSISREKVNKYLLYGNLIMSNLYNNPDYQACINVVDYENNKEITINLDKSKTLKENANRYFKLYNKGKTSLEKSEELSNELKAQISYLEQILYSVEISLTIDDLYEIQAEIDPEREKREIKTSAAMPLQLDINGFKIYVGRNNKQNDYIVSKLSKDDDLWFHTKGCAGSHVLLKCDNPSNEIILKCAELAKKYSKGALSSKIGIIYTKRKYLKKPAGANLGYVTYKNEQEIIL